MDKSVRQRILDSFQGDKATVEAKEYSEKVFSAWKDVSASLSRSALLIFLLIAVFELLVYQSTATIISIGTFTFVNSSTVQIVLPIVITFVIYDGFRLSARWLRLERAYVTLTEIYAQRQRDNALDLLIEPNLPSVWGIGTFGLGSTGEKSADEFMRNVNRTMSRIMMFAVPLIFECQAYYRLFQKFGYHNALLWISAIITIILILCVISYIWFGKLLESIN